MLIFYCNFLKFFRGACPRTPKIIVPFAFSIRETKPHDKFLRTTLLVHVTILKTHYRASFCGFDDVCGCGRQNIGLNIDTIIAICAAYARLLNKERRDYDGRDLFCGKQCQMHMQSVEARPALLSMKHSPSRGFPPNAERRFAQTRF